MIMKRKITKPNKHDVEIELVKHGLGAEVARNHRLRIITYAIVAPISGTAASVLAQLLAHR